MLAALSLNCIDPFKQLKVSKQCIRRLSIQYMERSKYISKEKSTTAITNNLIMWRISDVTSETNRNLLTKFLQF